MNNNNEECSVNVGLLGLLTLLFIGLKLTSAIDWSWWYVLMPMYIAVAITIGLIVLAWALASVAALIQYSIYKFKTIKK